MNVCPEDIAMKGYAVPRCDGLQATCTVKDDFGNRHGSAHKMGSRRYKKSIEILICAFFYIASSLLRIRFCSLN